MANKKARGKIRPDLLTVTQAAAFLGKDFTRQGVLVAITRGRLEAHRYGNVYLIERTALEQYSHTRKPGRPPGPKKKDSAKKRH